MAVGKGSMARASKAVAKPEIKVEEKVDGEVKKAPAKKAPVKKAKAPKQAVIASTSEQVMDTIVYQKSSQILDRDANPNESFYVGDAMPIYFF